MHVIIAQHIKTNIIWFELPRLEPNNTFIRYIYKQHEQRKKHSKRNSKIVHNILYINMLIIRHQIPNSKSFSQIIYIYDNISNYCNVKLTTLVVYMSMLLCMANIYEHKKNIFDISPHELITFSHQGIRARTSPHDQRGARANGQPGTGVQKRSD